MGAQPATPAAGLVKDAIGAPVVQTTSPAAGAGGVQPNLPVTATFDRPSSIRPRSAQPTSRCATPAASRSPPRSRSTPPRARDADAGRDARAVRRLHRPDRGRRQELARRGADLAAHVDLHAPVRARRPSSRPARPPRARPASPPTSWSTARFDRRLNPASVSSSTVRLRERGRRARPRPGHLRRRRPAPCGSTPTRRSPRPRRYTVELDDGVARQRRHADGLGGVVELHDRPEPAGHVAHSAPAGERDVAGRRGARRVLPRRRHRHAERLQLPAHRPRRTAGAGAGDLRRDDAHGDAAPRRAADAAQHLHGERHGRRARGRRRRHRAVRLDVHDGRHAAARAGRDRGDAGRRQPGRHARRARPRDVRPAARPRDGDDAELHAHARRRIAGGRDRHL